MISAVHIEVYGDPDNTRGGFYDTSTRRMLSMTVESNDLAQAFVTTCERIGVDMTELSEQHLRWMYSVWHDAFKRPS